MNLSAISCASPKPDGDKVTGLAYTGDRDGLAGRVTTIPVSGWGAWGVMVRTGATRPTSSSPAGWRTGMAVTGEREELGGWTTWPVRVGAGAGARSGYSS